MEEVMVDSTCCRAHQSSAGARKISNPQAIGLTRVGLNTKIHAVCDALGNPLCFVLTAGQCHDAKPVPELLDGLQSKALLADKAHDTDKIVQAAQAFGLKQWLSHFHGVATGYLDNYLSWFRALDGHHANSRQAVLTMALGRFPHLTVT